MAREAKPISLSVDLVEDVPVEEEELPTPPDIVPAPAPLEFKPLPVSRFNLSAVKGYKAKKAERKQQLLVSNTVAELKHAISIFDPEEISLNHSLILFVCQIVEDVFTKPGLGEIKKDVVIQVCQEFFHNSAELVNMVIDIVFEKVIKTSWFRQNKTKIKDIFFWVMKLFGDKLDIRYQTNFKTSLEP